MKAETLIYLSLSLLILIIGVIALSVQVIQLRKINRKTAESDQAHEAEVNRLKQEISMMDTNLDILKIINDSDDE